MASSRPVSGVAGLSTSRPGLSTSRPGLACSRPVSEYEYETDSGCLSVRVRMKEDEVEEEPQPEPVVPRLGLGDLRRWRELVRAVVAEAVGVLVLVLVGCGACTGGDAGRQVDDQANTVRIALTFGLAVASLAAGLGHISGAHLNPGVTLGLWLGRQVGLLRALLYVGAQCAGAAAGAALLAILVPAGSRGVAGLGRTMPGEGVAPLQAVGIEATITGLLVLVVTATAGDPAHSPGMKGSAPLAIGLTVTTCHLMAVPYTGSSMNPARSLGPAAVLGDFSLHWIYWVGPMLGAALAATIYKVLRPPTPGRRRPRHASPSPPYEPPTPRPPTSPASPAAQGSSAPASPNAFNVLVTQETGGRELVWVENSPQAPRH